MAGGGEGERGILASVAETPPMNDYREMLEDIRDYDAAMQATAAGEELVPAGVVYALLDGENPVRVWRLHRGLTQVEVAERAGISTAYLSRIESGTRAGTTDVLSKIAAALNLTLDDLVS